jgi:membrane-anchored protein YejM (alkaline phosphatase superfamily)
LILLLGYLFLTLVVLQWAVTTLIKDTSLFQMIDWHLNYSVEQVYVLLKSYGSESREWYTLIELTLNSIIPFIYAFLFAFAIILVCRKLQVKEQVIKNLLLIPFAALVADLLENTCILLLLTNYPYKLTLIAKTANILTYTKWILIMINAALACNGKPADQFPLHQIQIYT